MKLLNEDTITAVATPPGIGGISVIRISGSNSIPAITKIFKTKNNLKEFPSHTIHYGKIETPLGELIDDVLVSVFLNPHSYTGEDCVEISTHGNPIITHKIISLLLADNIRTAEPGEFTKRAFLNGKLDLTQAEAVADLINARTEASLTGARNQLNGYLSSKINSIRDLLVNIFSMLELELDFAEEDINFLSKAEVIAQVEKTITEIKNLIKSYSFGKIIRDGVNVALVGKPNVGKSSLLNHLLRESRAIVSEIPGTTRDVIREEIEFSGILFRLHDTAGIRATEDIIEKEGVERSREAVKNANFVLLIDDPATEYSEELYNKLLELTKKEKIIRLINKIDLLNTQPAGYEAYVSAKTGQGIEELLKLLKQKALGHSNYSENTPFITNARHYENLKKSKKSLQSVLESINNNYSEEFISMDLRNAENNLSEILGKVTNDDVLNNIFSKFCIGK